MSHRRDHVAYRKWSSHVSIFIWELNVYRPSTVRMRHDEPPLPPTRTRIFYIGCVLKPPWGMRVASSNPTPIPTLQHVWNINPKRNLKGWLYPRDMKRLYMQFAKRSMAAHTFPVPGIRTMWIISWWFDSQQGRDFYRIGYNAIPTSSLIDIWATFSGVKRSEREADRKSQTGAEIKSAWRYTSIPT
jgi:hypothetical protein